MTFAYPWLLALLGLVPVIFAVWVWGMARGRRRARALSRTPAPRPPIAAAFCFAVAAGLAIVAAAGPRWGERESAIPRTGAQLVVVLDVSRSMAVEDVVPNRLDAAKAALGATFARLGGDCVGLVIFAGDARLRFPLTTDFNAAARVIESLEVGTVLVGAGTSAASGLDVGLEAFETEVDTGRLLFLISDGDDLGEDPVAVAERVRASGVDLIVVGAGTAAGGPVRVFDSESGTSIDVVDAEGAAVVSHLNETFLRALAVAAGGRYLGSDLGALPGAVEGRLTTLKRTTIDRQAASLPVERFQWFAGAALAMVVAGSVVERLRRPGRRTATAGFALAAGLLVASCATRAHDANEDGIEAFRASDYGAAAEMFLEAQAEQPNDAEISLNLAAALHADGRFEEASLAARRALDSRSAETRARAHASIGHHRFALEDLPGSLDAFREALIEDPGHEASRHDYEVVLRLLFPPEPPAPGEEEPGSEPGGESPTPSDGASPPGEATPPAGEQTPPSAPGEGEGEGDGETGDGTPQPGPGDPNSGGSARPATPAEVDSQIAAIDSGIAALLEESGENPTASQAIEILDLLAERQRLTGIRNALSGGGDPNDR